MNPSRRVDDSEERSEVDATAWGDGASGRRRSWRLRESGTPIPLAPRGSVVATALATGAIGLFTVRG